MVCPTLKMAKLWELLHGRRFRMIEFLPCFLLALLAVRVIWWLKNQPKCPKCGERWHFGWSERYEESLFGKKYECRDLHCYKCGFEEIKRYKI